MNEKVVLVTGASSGLGNRVLAAVGNRGWRTRALVHRRAVEDADESVRGTIVDPDAVHRATIGVGAIIHLAALTHSRDPGAYDAINASGTANVVAAALASGVSRVVHVSSRAISASGGAYSVSKLRAEEAVAQSSLDHVIIRLAEVYGSGGNEGVERIVRAARRGALIPVVGNASDELCPIFVDDAADAVAGALEARNALGKTYTVGGDCLTLAEFVEECGRAFGSRSRIVPVPAFGVRLAGTASRWLPLPLYPDQLARLRSPKGSPSPEAESELSFRARPLREGLGAAQ